MKKFNIDEFIFKPIQLKDPKTEESRLVIIYKVDVSNKIFLDDDQKKSTNTSHTLGLLDVMRTIDRENPVFANFNVEAIDKFKNNCTIVDPEEFAEEIDFCMSIVFDDMIETNDRLNEVSMILSNLQQINSELPDCICDECRQETEDEQEKDNENLILGGDSGPLAHLVMRSIEGVKQKLKKDDIDKIGNVLLQIIKSHTDTDFQVKDTVEKLKAEIEYKLVDALPSVLKAGKINLNMKAILEEIIINKDEDNDEDDD